MLFCSVVKPESNACGFINIRNDFELVISMGSIELEFAGEQPLTAAALLDLEEDGGGEGTIGEEIEEIAEFSVF